MMDTAGFGSGMTGKTVLVRADLSEGIEPSLALAANRLALAGARVVVIAGIGAPRGEFHPALSLKEFRRPLEQATGIAVTFIEDCVGAVAETGLAGVRFGEIALLENLRFHNDARRNSRVFAVRLSVLGDYFIVTGRLSEPPANWLTALQALLPAPDIDIEKEVS